MSTATAEQPRDSAFHLYPPKAARDAASTLIEQARIPHISDVVMALREGLKRPEPNLQAASDLVARDPATTGDLIKAINSPAFNLRTKVTSIPQAATLMGLPRLTHYVTAVAMKRVVDGMDPRVHDVWQDIMEEVETMVAIAEVLPGLSAEETYLFGILHDIGALIFATQSGDYIARWVLYNTVEPSALLDYERTTMGVEHGVVAFMMASPLEALRGACPGHVLSPRAWVSRRARPTHQQTDRGQQGRWVSGFLVARHRHASGDRPELHGGAQGARHQQARLDVSLRPGRVLHLDQRHLGQTGQSRRRRWGAARRGHLARPVSHLGSRNDRGHTRERTARVRNDRSPRMDGCS